MKKIVLPVALALLGMNAGAYAADVSIDILSATVKDKRIEGASVTLQRNGAQSVSGITNTSGSISLGTSFADNKDALLIVKKEGYSNLVVKCPCAGMTYAISPVMTNLDGMRVVLSWGEKPFDLDSHLIFHGGHIYFDSKEELMPIWMLMIRIAMDQKLSLSAKSILVKVTSMPCRTIAIKGCPTVIISLPVRQKCLFM